MSKAREDVKLLLVQMRSDESKEHEQKCFLKYGRLQPGQLDFFDAIHNVVSNDIVDGYDGVFIGGSGECRISDGEPANLPQILNLINYCIAQEIPLFGVCYGAHALAQAIGGEVRFSPETKEMSAEKMYLLKPAKNDKLFHDMPDEFLTNCGHTDDIFSLPEEAVVLARSDKVKYHAFRVVGKPVYAVMFHPDLGQQEDQERSMFSFQQHGYFESEEELQKNLEMSAETPESTSLIDKFVNRIVCG